MQYNHSSSIKRLKILWDPTMHHVGHPMIDAQHKKLADIGNQLIEMAQQWETVDREYFRQQMVAFHQVLVQHLKYEEALLERFSVTEEELEEHHKGHDKFAQFVQSMIDGYECKPDPVGCVTQILQYTNHHIFIDDFRLVDEFRRIGSEFVDTKQASASSLRTSISQAAVA